MARDITLTPPDRQEQSLILACQNMEKANIRAGRLSTSLQVEKLLP